MNTFRNFRVAAAGAFLFAAAASVAVSQPPVSARNGAGAAQRGDSARGDRRQGERQGRDRVGDQRRSGAPQGESRRGGRGPGFGRGLLQGITLSSTQQEQLRALQQRFVAQRPDSLRPRLRDGAMRTQGATRARPDSAARVAMIAQRQQEFDRHASEIRNILTADQRTTFDQNVRTMREKLAKGPRHVGKGDRAGR